MLRYGFIREPKSTGIDNSWMLNSPSARNAKGRHMQNYDEGLRRSSEDTLKEKEAAQTAEIAGLEAALAKLTSLVQGCTTENQRLIMELAAGKKTTPMRISEKLMYC